MIAIICLALVISGFPGIAEAAQLGRITGDVNFREGPSRSTPVIEVLPAGTEIQVLSDGPGTWYRVQLQGRPGFVHKNYIRFGHDQNPGRRFQPKSGQLAITTGIVLAGVGIMLMASVLAPDLLITATALVVALVSIAVFDLLFQLGVLYSSFCVSFGVLALVLVLRRKKRNRTVSADARFYATRKAA